MGVNPLSSQSVPMPGDETLDDHGVSGGDSPESDRQTDSQDTSAAESPRAAAPSRDSPIVNQSVLAYLAQQRGAGQLSATGQHAASRISQAVSRPNVTTRTASPQATPELPSSANASGKPGDAGPADTSKTTQMPSIGGALMQGLTASAQDFQRTGSAIGGGRPDVEHHASAAAAPMQWHDVLSPSSVLGPKLAYQIARSWPSTAAGIAGASLGVAAVGGPEDPLAIVTGPLGGAVGAGMVSGLQSFGNYFGDELHKTPGDPDGAYNRAFQRATVAGAFSGAAWAAFPMRAFQGPLKNLMFQAFGVQPSISMAHQATDNALSGKPLTEGLGTAYTQGAIGTATIAGGFHAAKLAGQYEVQVDPSALGSNLGNVRIVKKTGAQATGTSEAKGAADATTGSADVPEGLAFHSRLPQHLAGPDGFNGKNLYGTHNLENAKAALNAKGAKYELTPTGTPGISTLKYSYENAAGKQIKVREKTVYDPAIYSDAKILEMAQAAGQRGFQIWKSNPVGYTVDVKESGVNFRVYINTDKATGQPIVGNVHPIP